MPSESEAAGTGSEEGQSKDPKKLLEAAASSRPTAINAQTYVKKWGTSSNPVALICDDGHTYVVKARQPNNATIGHVVVAEQVVARIGLLIGAPVPEVALVEVPALLVSAQPEMGHMQPGVAHGSRFMADVTEQMALDNTHAENRERFALLAVLYGWMAASDHQFVYNKTGPRLVHSVDHGHFFPGGPNWTLASLTQPSSAQLDSTITNACALTQEEKENAVRHLVKVKETDLARIVAIPPEDWGFVEAERIALLDYLTRRRDEILAAFPVKSGDSK